MGLDKVVASDGGTGWPSGIMVERPVTGGALDDRVVALVKVQTRSNAGDARCVVRVVAERKSTHRVGRRGHVGDRGLANEVILTALRLVGVMSHRLESG